MADTLKCLTDDDGIELKDGYISGGYADFDVYEEGGYFNTSDELCYWDSKYYSSANFILNGHKYCAIYNFRCQLQTSSGFHSFEDYLENNETELFDENDEPIYDFSGLPMTADGEPMIQKPDSCYFSTPPICDTAVILIYDVGDYSDFNEDTELDEITDNTELTDFKDGFTDSCSSNDDIDSFDKLKEDFKASKLNITWPEFLKKLEETARESVFEWGLNFKGFEVY